MISTSHTQDALFSKLQLDNALQGSRGVSVADLDGNGLLDIVVANQVDSILLLGNTIYFNNGDGFQKSAIADKNVNAWSESVHTIDVDNDYDFDIFFTTQFGMPSLLYLNDGSGKFILTQSGNLGEDKTNSPGACWSDHDLDGDLDVFIVNRDGEDDNLYINDGRGLFSRASVGPWIGNRGDGRSCAWGDLNGDGRPDLYVANFIVKENGEVKGKHRNYLYMNSTNGTFVQQNDGIHVEEENASYGVTFVDYDYDKDLDIYVTNVSTLDENVLYENSGNGSFEKKTDSKIVLDVRRPSKGQTWGDFNNDGWLDVYIANGTEGYPEIQNFLFLGTPDRSFKRVYNTLASNEGHISAGTASGDIDNDGDLDLYVCNWGDNGEANDLYLNEIQINNWVKFRLRGIKSNSYGIGSWIRLALDDGTVQTRYFSRDTGYGSENAPEVHFGFAASVGIKSFEVEWPSGLSQTSFNIEANQIYQVVEGDEIRRLKK